MELKDKYADVINTATRNGVANLQVIEKNNVLYVDGTAPSEAAKKQVWDVYEKIDPDFRMADMVLNINATESATYEVKPGDSLSKIGLQFGKSWRQIYGANKDVIGDNPDLIKPGQALKIP